MIVLLSFIFASSDYTNPIIDADYSDPDVIRVGDDFYLTASSFNCIPGLPILHSKDLVNWKIIGHALQRPTSSRTSSRDRNTAMEFGRRRSVFTTDYFYIFYGDPDFGIYMVKARNAAGPWSPPLLIKRPKDGSIRVRSGTMMETPIWFTRGPTADPG